VQGGRVTLRDTTSGATLAVLVDSVDPGTLYARIREARGDLDPGLDPSSRGWRWAWAPDGRLAGWSQRGPTRLRVWDGQTGAELAETDTGARIDRVRWSPQPEGGLVVTDTEATRLWSGLSEVVGLGTATAVATWSPAGRAIAVSDLGVLVFDAAGALLGTCEGTRVAWSPEGDRFVTWSAEPTVRVWSQRGEPLAELTLGRSDHVSAVAWSPPRLALVHHSSTGVLRVTVWDTRLDELLLDVQDAQLVSSAGWDEEDRWARAVGWSPDGSTLAVCAEEGAVVWDVGRGQLSVLRCPAERDGEEVQPSGVRWSPDGRWLVGWADGTDQMWVWEPPEAQPVRVFDFPPVSMSPMRTGVSWSPDGRHLVGSWPGTFQVWTPGTDRVAVHDTGSRNISQALAHATSLGVVVSVEQGTRRLWDPDTLTGAEASECAAEARRRTGLGMEGLDAIRARTGPTWRSLPAPLLASMFLEELGKQTRRGRWDHAALVAVQALGTAAEGTALRFLLARTLHRLRRPTAELEGHDQMVMDLAFQDDTTLVTAGYDGSVIVWDVQKGEQRLLLAHPDRVWTAQPSQDGDHLVTPCNDGTVRIWSLSDGSLERELVGHTQRVLLARFHPHGTLVASCGDDGTARVWDVASGDLLHTLTAGGQGPVFDLCFTPDGERLLTGSRDGDARLWDVTSGELLATLVGANGPIRHLDVDWRGALAVTASEEGVVRVWDLESGGLLFTHDVVPVLPDRAFFRPDYFYPTATLSPAGDLLLTTGGGVAFVWSTRDGSLVQVLPHGGLVYSVAFVGQDRILTTGTGRCRLWDANGRLLALLDGIRSDGLRCATTKDRVAVGTGDGNSASPVLLWDLPELGVVESTEACSHGQREGALAIATAGQRMGILDPDGGLRLLDAQTAALLAEANLAESPAWGTLRFSPDGGRLAAVIDGEAWVWTPPEPPRPLAEGNEEIQDVAFDLRGSRLVTVTRRGAWLWDVATGVSLGQLSGEPTCCVAFRSDAQLVALGHPSGEVSVVDPVSGKTLVHFDTLSGPFPHVRFSEDDRSILTTPCWEPPGRLGSLVHALHAHREQTGSFPETLAELDPARAQPDGVTYAQTAEGFVLTDRGAVFVYPPPGQRAEYDASPETGTREDLMTELGELVPQLEWDEDRGVIERER
jgi:WD40 repeat protein